MEDTSAHPARRGGAAATIDGYLHAPYAADPFVFVTLDGGAELARTGALSLDAAIRRAEEP